MSLAGEVVAVVAVFPADSGAAVKARVAAAGGPLAVYQRLLWKGREFSDLAVAAEFGLPASGTCSLTLVVATPRCADACIEKYLGANDGDDKPIAHRPQDLTALCKQAQQVLLAEPPLLDLSPPLAICGDLFGQLSDLRTIFRTVGSPPDVRFLFLGNYVDCGKQGLDVIALLLSYKLKYPKDVFLLRGNHETATMNRIYGFYEECKRRYNLILWRHFCRVFACLPLCALVDQKIFCVHGGLSPELHHIEQVRQLERPLEQLPESGLICDLLWSDPDMEIDGWEENDRGISFTFGLDIVNRFVQRHNLQLICRGHQLCPDGYTFSCGQRLVTISSSPHSAGHGEFETQGAVMHVDQALECTFQVFGRQ